MIREHHMTRYVVRCDGCGNQTTTVADGEGTPERAHEVALGYGWRIDEEDGQPLDLCPRCTEGPRS